MYVDSTYVWGGGSARSRPPAPSLPGGGIYKHTWFIFEKTTKIHYPKLIHA